MPIPRTPPQIVGFPPAALAATFLMLASQAYAATLPANSANLDAVLRAAGPGDTVLLAPGDYGTVTIKDRHWKRPIILDAHAAVFSQILIDNAGGIELRGGKIIGVGALSHGITLSQASSIAIEGMNISKVHAGIVVSISSKISIIGNILENLTSDGIDISSSSSIIVTSNICRGFFPRAATYDNFGRIEKDGDHPDCIQAWSRRELAPTSDLTITNNSSSGNMQGISLFNHVRHGVDDGGFDRVKILNNEIVTSAPNAISLYQGRNSLVAGNRVSSIPGSVIGVSGKRVKANINVFGGRENVVCGNVILDLPLVTATAPCAM